MKNSSAVFIPDKYLLDHVAAVTSHFVNKTLEIIADLIMQKVKLLNL